MAINGFMPAWMKIPSTDKSNSNQKLNIDRLDNSKSQAQNGINSTILTGQYRTKSNEHKLTSDINEQSENLLSFLSRRSYSRERLSKSFGKDPEPSINGYSFALNNRSTTNSNVNSQRRLHSVPSSLSSPYNNDLVSKPTRYSVPNGHNVERPLNDKSERKYRENSPDISTRSNEDNFVQLEKDFPSLNGLDSTLNNKERSTIWTNAPSKLRIADTNKYSRTLASNKLVSRGGDRVLKASNSVSMNPRPIIHELQTCCITQTRNLDKRSNFLNSLKVSSVSEETNASPPSKSVEDFNDTIKLTKEKLNLLAAPETSEEKDLLVRMGWNDDMSYEITEKDKEEYEAQMKCLPKTYNRSAALIKALHRRSLPYLNIRDVLQFEIIGSISDEDSSDD